MLSGQHQRILINRVASRTAILPSWWRLSNVDFASSGRHVTVGHFAALLSTVGGLDTDVEALLSVGAGYQVNIERRTSDEIQVSFSPYSAPVRSAEEFNQVQGSRWLGEIAQRRLAVALFNAQNHDEGAEVEHGEVEMRIVAGRQQYQQQEHRIALYSNATHYTAVEIITPEGRQRLELAPRRLAIGGLTSDLINSYRDMRGSQHTPSEQGCARSCIHTRAIMPTYDYPVVDSTKTINVSGSGLPIHCYLQDGGFRHKYIWNGLWVAPDNSVTIALDEETPGEFGHWDGQTRPLINNSALSGINSFRPNYSARVVSASEPTESAISSPSSGSEELPRQETRVTAPTPVSLDTPSLHEHITDTINSDVCGPYTGHVIRPYRPATQEFDKMVAEAGGAAAILDGLVQLEKEHAVTRTEWMALDLDCCLRPGDAFYNTLVVGFYGSYYIVPWYTAGMLKGKPSLSFMSIYHSSQAVGHSLPFTITHGKEECLSWPDHHHFHHGLPMTAWGSNKLEPGQMAFPGNVSDNHRHKHYYRRPVAAKTGPFRDLLVDFAREATEEEHEFTSSLFTQRKVFKNPIRGKNFFSFEGVHGFHNRPNETAAIGVTSHGLTRRAPWACRKMSALDHKYRQFGSTATHSLSIPTLLDDAPEDFESAMVALGWALDDWVTNEGIKTITISDISQPLANVVISSQVPPPGVAKDTFYIHWPGLESSVEQAFVRLVPFTLMTVQVPTKVLDGKLYDIPTANLGPLVSIPHAHGMPMAGRLFGVSGSLEKNRSTYIALLYHFGYLYGLDEWFLARVPIAILPIGPLQHFEWHVEEDRDDYDITVIGCLTKLTSGKAECVDRVKEELSRRGEVRAPAPARSKVSPPFDSRKKATWSYNPLRLKGGMWVDCALLLWIFFTSYIFFSLNLVQDSFAARYKWSVFLLPQVVGKFTHYLLHNNLIWSSIFFSICIFITIVMFLESNIGLISRFGVPEVLPENPNGLLTISKHPFPDKGDDQTPMDQTLLIAVGGTYGDKMPLLWLARFVAWLGIRVHYWITGTKTHEDLEKLQQGRWYEQMSFEFDLALAGTKGYRWALGPHIPLGDNGASYTLSPSSRWIHPLNFGDSLSGRALSFVTSLFSFEWHIGCLPDSDLPRAETEFSLMRQYPNTGEYEEGWCAGSAPIEWIPEVIRARAVEIKIPYHISELAKFKVLHTSGAAGIGDAGRACGCRVIGHDKGLDRNFKVEPTPDDWTQPSIGPFVGMLLQKGFKIDLSLWKRILLQMSYFITKWHFWLLHSVIIFGHLYLIYRFLMRHHLHFFATIVMMPFAYVWMASRSVNKVGRAFLWVAWHYPVLLFSSTWSGFFVFLTMIPPIARRIAAEVVNWKTNRTTMIIRKVPDFPLPFGHVILRDNVNGVEYQGRHLNKRAIFEDFGWVADSLFIPGNRRLLGKDNYIVYLFILIQVLIFSFCNLVTAIITTHRIMIIPSFFGFVIAAIMLSIGSSDGTTTTAEIQIPLPFNPRFLAEAVEAQKKNPYSAIWSCHTLALEQTAGEGFFSILFLATITVLSMTVLLPGTIAKFILNRWDIKIYGLSLREYLEKQEEDRQ